MLYTCEQIQQFVNSDGSEVDVIRLTANESEFGRKRPTLLLFHQPRPHDFEVGGVYAVDVVRQEVFRQ